MVAPVQVPLSGPHYCIGSSAERVADEKNDGGPWPVTGNYGVLATTPADQPLELHSRGTHPWSDSGGPSGPARAG
jgi:hypothetical protein